LARTKATTDESVLRRAPRQAVSFTLLDPTAERFNDVHRHLRILGPDAPAAPHLDILEAGRSLATVSSMAAPADAPALVAASRDDRITVPQIATQLRTWATV
jgi:hypothetical protein